MPFVEFVVMMAALMALNALAMDIMLPALPQIGEALHIVNENDRQLILIVYMAGFGIAQLFYGPITDTLGRRSVLLFGLALYAAASFFALYATTLPMLLLARVLQGIGCAATRVIAVSIVRDQYSGRRMGRVMSLIMMIFMAVPILAPSVGQLVMLFAGWNWIFALLLVAGLLMLVWCGFRLPETLSEENRQLFNIKTIWGAYKTSLTTRISLGYMLAITFLFGVSFSYLSMAQQIFVEIFHLGTWFPVIFASVAVFMAFTSFMNSHFVEAIGLRRLSHSALFIYLALAYLQLFLNLWGHESIVVFMITMALMMGSFGFIGGNFNAMAMEPLGQIAGTASAVIGFVTSLGAAILGFMIGRTFDGTLLPVGIAASTYGTIAFLCVLFAERGRLFQAHEKAPEMKAEHAGE